MNMANMKLWIGVFLAVIIAEIVLGYMPISAMVGIYLPFGLMDGIIKAVIVLIIYILLEKFLIKGPE